MDDRSGKSATSATFLIINDLAGNKIGNRPATDRQHFAGFSQVPALRLAVFQNFRQSAIAAAATAEALLGGATEEAFRI
jgi:hypothetical protein